MANITGNNNPNNLMGTSGNDTISGLGGNDTLDGKAGNDKLYGGDGNDFLKGQDGNDTLDGGTGNDLMQGGAGNDVYIVDNLLDNPQELAFGGTDTVRSSVNWTLGSDFNNLTLTGTAISGSGNNIANTIVGNASNNNIFGNAGNDLMYGGSGTDFLNGGSDNDLIQGFGYSTFEYDTMTGGVGADKFVLGDTSGSFYVGFGYATITDFQWEEVDKIQVKGPLSDYTLDPNVNFGGGAALDTAIYRSGELIGVALDQTDLIISLDFLGV